MRLLPGLILSLGLLAITASAAQEKKTSKKPAPKPAATPGAPRDTPASAVPKLVFEKYTLPNGLHVILHVDRKLPMVHVNQWFHVGSKNEKPGRTGFAHLFEHLMFEGSKNAPDKYLKFAEKAGANLGEGGVNGTTNEDRTNYFITVPSGSLETVLWLESDRLFTLMDFLTKENLDHQRDVVKNERRQGLENTPYGRAFKLISENLYPAAHPYSWPVIGSHEDLTAATFEDVKDFFRSYYTPNNLTLTIAGDFDPADAKKLVEKYLGPIPPGPALDRPGRFDATLLSEKVVEVKDRVPQERVYVAWPSPPYFAPGDAELALAGLILTDGLSSRLNKVLVYDRQLATSVTSFQRSGEIAGGFVVIATARPGASLAEIERILTSEIHKLAIDGPTAAELNRAKTKREFEFVTGLERIGGFGGKADLLNRYDTFLGDPGKLEEDVERFRRVSESDVRDAASAWLATNDRVVVRFHPEVSARPAESTLDRGKQPPLAPDRPFQTPEVKERKLANGLTVLVVEKPELPKVAVTLVSRAGSVNDAPGKAGLAYLAATTMSTGTKTRKALEIEDALGDLGVTLSARTSKEDASVDFEVLKRNLAAALFIVADVVENATYPESEIERERKRHLDRLSQQSKNANQVAARLRSMLVFGAEHPYGRPTQGLPSTVSTITREDVQRFHDAHWKPADSAIAFVGDVTLAEAVDLTKTAFGAWAGAAPPRPEIPAARPASSSKVYVVDRPDAAQTVISDFLPGPRRNVPDYYALELVNTVLGGGFNSRLNLNLREGKGYSYGAFSFLSAYDHSSLWTAQAGVQTNKTKESVVEFQKEMKDVAGARPVDDKELVDAKAARVRGYAQQFESLRRIADQVTETWARDLPMSELQREVDETRRLTLADVRAAEKTYTQASGPTLLLVGDLGKIGPGLKELGLDVVVLDAEGKPVK